MTGAAISARHLASGNMFPFFSKVGADFAKHGSQRLQRLPEPFNFCVVAMRCHFRNNPAHEPPLRCPNPSTCQVLGLLDPAITRSLSLVPSPTGRMHSQA